MKFNYHGGVPFLPPRLSWLVCNKKWVRTQQNLGTAYAAGVSDADWESLGMVGFASFILIPLWPTFLPEVNSRTLPKTVSQYETDLRSPFFGRVKLFPKTCNKLDPCLCEPSWVPPDSCTQLRGWRSPASMIDDLEPAPIKVFPLWWTMASSYPSYSFWSG